MTGSPRASAAGASWRSGGGARGDAAAPNNTTSPSTPLAQQDVTFLSVDGSTAPSPLLSSPTASGAGAKSGAWTPPSLAAHHRLAAQTHGASDGGGTPAARSSGGGSGGGGDGGSGGLNRRQRRSLDMAARQAANAATGGRVSPGPDAAAPAAAAAAAAAAADSALSDSSLSGNGARGAPGRQQGKGSRLSAAATTFSPTNDFHATIEAIREASCELDNGAVGRAMAAMTVSGGGGSGGQRRRSGTGGAGGSNSGGRSRGGGEQRQHTHHHQQQQQQQQQQQCDRAHRGARRHRRSLSSGSRRESLDEGPRRPSFEGPASDGVAAVGLSPRGVRRAGPLTPDGVGRERHPAGNAAHDGSQQHGASSGGGASKKKSKKKDYASWAAATPQFRAEAAAAKHNGCGEGGGGDKAADAARLARGADASPLRATLLDGGSAPGGGPPAGHGHDLVHVARMPDGSRGFAMGRGRPLAQPPP
jgi:Flp pilus assembly protein TadG